MSAELIGFIAATLTTLAFVPQAVKIHRSKHTKDLSLSLFVMFSIGVALWFAYGLMTGSLPVIVANAVTLALSIYILTMKVRYG